MRCVICIMCGLAALFIAGASRTVFAQQEVVHPGETYDPLQAGQDAYGDAEAQRRALIGRQLMLEEQIQAQNTWSDPQAKYRPVQPESYGPVRPSVYTGPTLADVYGYGQSGVVYYNQQPGAPLPAAGAPAPRVGGAYGTYGAYAAPVPAFESWPRVPGDIWGTPYYGYVRQPIGHVKIWTGRLSYIYKPVYASPAMETALPSGYPMPAQRGRAVTQPRSYSAPSSPGTQQVPPPPPRPSLPHSAPAAEKPAAGEGQEI